MGCTASTATGPDGNRRGPSKIGQVAVYVPGLRIPKTLNFSQSLGDNLLKDLDERLTALRNRTVVMYGQGGLNFARSRRKSMHGGSILSDLQQSLEDYLPVLLGLVKDGNPLQQMAQFVWVNQEDDAQVLISKSGDKSAGNEDGVMIVDYRGNPIGKSQTGGWTGAGLVIGTELADGSCVTGIAMN